VRLLEVGQQARQVIAHAGVLDLRAEAWQGRVGAGGDDHSLLGLVQDRQVDGEVEAPAHNHGDRIRSEALGHALLTQLLRLRHAPVALTAHRARADHHGIGLRAEVMEEPPVELRREAFGAPLDRRIAVEARDHVEPEPGSAGRRQLCQPHAARQLLGRGGAALGVDQLHAEERTDVKLT
jgi:hypothetical protein